MNKIFMKNVFQKKIVRIALFHIFFQGSLLPGLVRESWVVVAAADFGLS